MMTRRKELFLDDWEDRCDSYYLSKHRGWKQKCIRCGKYFEKVRKGGGHKLCEVCRKKRK